MAGVYDPGTWFSKWLCVRRYVLSSLLLIALDTEFAEVMLIVDVSEILVFAFTHSSVVNHSIMSRSTT